MTKNNRGNAVEGSNNNGNNELKQGNFHHRCSKVASALLVALALTTGSSFVSSCHKEGPDNPGTEIVQEKTPSIQLILNSISVPSNGINVQIKQTGESDWSIYIGDTCVATLTNTKEVSILDKNGTQISIATPGIYTINAEYGNKRSSKNFECTKECNILASESKVNVFGGGILTIKDSGVYINGTKIFYSKDGTSIDRENYIILFNKGDCRSNNPDDSITQLGNNSVLEEPGHIILKDKYGNNITSIEITYNIPGEWQIPSDLELGQSYDLTKFIKLDNGWNINNIIINGETVSNENIYTYQFPGVGAYKLTFNIKNGDKNGSITYGEELDVKAQEYKPPIFDKIDINEKYSRFTEMKNKYPLKASALEPYLHLNTIIEQFCNENPNHDCFILLGEGNNMYSPIEGSSECTSSDHARGMFDNFRFMYSLPDKNVHYCNGNDLDALEAFIENHSSQFPDAPIHIAHACDLISVPKENRAQYKNTPYMQALRRIIQHNNVVFTSAVGNTINKETTPSENSPTGGYLGVQGLDGVVAIGGAMFEKRPEDNPEGPEIMIKTLQPDGSNKIFSTHSSVLMDKDIFYSPAITANSGNSSYASATATAEIGILLKIYKQNHNNDTTGFSKNLVSRPYQYSINGEERENGTGKIVSFDIESFFENEVTPKIDMNNLKNKDNLSYLVYYGPGVLFRYNGTLYPTTYENMELLNKIIKDGEIDKITGIYDPNYAARYGGTGTKADITCIRITKEGKQIL